MSQITAALCGAPRSVRDARGALDVQESGRNQIIGNGFDGWQPYERHATQRQSACEANVLLSAPVTFHPGHAHDLASGNVPTLFQRLASNVGTRHVTGEVGMLVDQAVEAFACW
jgi:hypothetical protein